MSGGTNTQTTNNVAGSKRRSLSGQGGLLGRMFGSKDSNNSSREQIDTHGANNSNNGNGNNSQGNNANQGGDGSGNNNGNASPRSPNLNNNQSNSIPEESQDGVSNELRSPTRKEAPEGNAKRRSSGVGRAGDLFNRAKQALSGSPDSKSSHQTPMQKLGRTDPALSVPAGSLNNSAGESVPGPRSTFRVGVTEDKNKKCRRTMEDTHAYLYNFLSTPAPFLGSDGSSSKRLSQSQSRDSAVSDSTQNSKQDVVETDNGYFAIFDGHAGTFAAEWCGKKVHLLLEDIIRKNPNTAIPELLDMTFTTVDQQLEKLPLKNSGCTAVLAVLRWEDRIPNSQSATGSTALAPATAESGNVERTAQQASRQRVLYTANVGDARIVLCRNGKALRLSYDHKGSDENEGKRIAGAGGLILNNRVNGVLAVTRALGDAYMKDLVTGHPYTTETVIQPDMDEFLILACDGLWDVCSDQEAVDLVRNIQDPQAASKALVDHALARFSTDNLSCMVVRFDNSKLQATQQQSDIGVEGDPSSKGGVTEADAIVSESKKFIEQGGDPLALTLSQPTTNEMMAEVERSQEVGPELNPAALEHARKDNKPPKMHDGPPTPATENPANGANMANAMLEHNVAAGDHQMGNAEDQNQNNGQQQQAMQQQGLSQGGQQQNNQQNFQHGGEHGGEQQQQQR
ncbi:hypothetical protein CBER1_03521 [Cercospora berteroae]|uniref:PPM-type phosphatase domain-containing protein n=1 Tax=Cercospora berteroae TaxID=357750 RepID=A0A2S6CFY5_9PEZI|nr:hypothetical protein CBER1_03521 [Cercospora berteroae]